MTDNHQFPNSNTILDVIQRDLDWAKAHLDLDLDVITEIASDDYKQRQADGTFTGKTELLSSFGSGDRYWELAKSTDHFVHIDDDLAIVIGHWHGIGINTGVNFDYRARFLSVYKLEKGSWRMILDMSVPESAIS